MKARPLPSRKEGSQHAGIADAGPDAGSDRLSAGRKTGLDKSACAIARFHRDLSRIAEVLAQRIIFASEEEYN